MIKVAYSKHSRASVVARACANQIGTVPGGGAGPGDEAAPGLLLAVCGGRLDPRAVLAELRDAFGSVPVFGGSAAGAISRGGFGYTGFELGLIAFFDPAITPQAVITRRLMDDERKAGRELGDAVRRIATDGAVVLLLFDSVASASPPRLHPASAIVGGFYDGFGDAPLALIGGGLLTDMNLSDGWVYDGVGVVKHTAVALVFPPQVSLATAVMHGCRPVSAFMEITRIDGAEVFELDGRPALTVIERMLNLPLGGTRGQELSLVATLGQKQGDPYAPYDENAYVNRLILRANAEAGSITLFEPDFARGMQVQIMGRDNSLMLDSVRRGLAAANRDAANADNLLAFYIDCAGRGSARSGASIEEAEIIINGLDPTVPLLGFYSGVEIAPFASGRSRPLDWTGVLAVLQRRA